MFHAKHPAAHAHEHKLFAGVGVSGAKGRNQRLSSDATLKDASRRRFDGVLAWALIGSGVVDQPIGYLGEFGARGGMGPPPASNGPTTPARDDVLSGHRGHSPKFKRG